jgi:ABC-type histidine transport system ATPase subunit
MKIRSSVVGIVGEIRAMIVVRHVGILAREVGTEMIAVHRVGIRAMIMPGRHVSLAK